MNRITIDLDALEYNLHVITNWVDRHGATLTVVTKAVCGHTDTLSALRDLGVESMSGSPAARAIVNVTSPDIACAQ